jgi:hypothetical protein
MKFSSGIAKETAMEAMNQEFQMFFQNAGILTIGYTLFIGLCGMFLFAAYTDLFAKGGQEKVNTMRKGR